MTTKAATEAFWLASSFWLASKAAIEVQNRHRVTSKAVIEAQTCLWLNPKAAIEAFWLALSFWLASEATDAEATHDNLQMYDSYVAKAEASAMVCSYRERYAACMFSRFCIFGGIFRIQLPSGWRVPSHVLLARQKSLAR